MRRMDWHIASRLALYAAGIQLALAQMVLLLHTLLILRPLLDGALPMSVFWDAYLGALPNVFYLTLPLSTAFALIIGYIHLLQDHAFTALFATGTSHWRLAAPGLAVAVGAAIAGATVAHVWAPRGAERLEDAKHYVRLELPHRLLPESQFVDLVPLKLTLYFKEWIGADVVSGISVYDRRDAREHRVIDAKAARFVREGRTLSLLFGPGSLHTFDRSDGQTRSVAFHEFALEYPLDVDPALAERPSPHFYTNGTARLFAPPAEIRARADWFRHSQAELHKRLATPFFVFCYVPLILGLVFFMDRRGRGTTLMLAALPAMIAGAHVALIVTFEIGVRTGPGVAFLGYAILAVLAASGATLIHLHNSGRAPLLVAGTRALLRRCSRAALGWPPPAPALAASSARRVSRPGPARR